MKTLHILKSEPTPMTRDFIGATSTGSESEQISIYDEDIDYSRLVNEIFSSDRVICWW